MFKKLSSLFSIGFASLLLIGCSSGSSDSSQNSEMALNNQSAYLSDSRIQGVTYKCGSLTGTTDQNGSFQYNNGCTEVEFSIGNIYLGTISTANLTADAIFYPSDLLSLDRNDTSSENLATLLQVLQTLDNDNNPNNGIVIDNQTANLFQNTTAFRLDNNSTVPSDLNNTVKSLTGKSLIAKNYAIAHYEDTLRNDLNISIDTVAPAPGILETSNLKTNSDTKTITIFGETDAKIYIDSVNTNEIIGSNNQVQITLDTSGTDGNKTFELLLQDSLDQNSSITYINILKDTTSPVFESSSDISVDENSPAGTSLGNITANDNDTINYALTNSNESIFDINATTGELVLKASPDYELTKTYSLQVKASDSFSNSSTQEVIVMINNLNDNAPQITTLSTLYIDETNTQITSLVSTDEDNSSQEFVYSIVGGNDKNSFTLNNNMLSFQDLKSYNTPTDTNLDNVYEILIQVSDGVNTSNTDFNITVTPVNRYAPVLTSENSVSINENSTISPLTLTHTDADTMQQTFTYTISGVDANYFNIDQNSGIITFKQAPDYEQKKSYNISAVVNDGPHDSAVQEIIININPLNDIAPLLTNSNEITVDENTINALTLTSSDNDQNQIQTFTYSIAGTDAEYFNIQSSTGLITFKEISDYESKSTYSILASVSDGENESETEAITINLNHLNDEIPVITNTNNISINENSTVAFTLTSSDNDQNETQTFTYSIAGTDANYFTIDANSGLVSFIDAPNYENPIDSNRDNNYVLNVFVNDGVNSSSSKTMNIEILNVDDVPHPQAFTNTIRGLVTNGSPIENATVVLQDSLSNILETTTSSDGTFSFDINNSMSAPYIFKVFLADGSILYSYNTGEYEVTNVNPITSYTIFKLAQLLDNRVPNELFLDFNSLNSNNNMNTLFTQTYNQNTLFMNNLLSTHLLSGYNHFFNESYNSGFDYLDTVMNEVASNVYLDYIVLNIEGTLYTNIPNYIDAQTQISGYIFDENGVAVDGALIRTSILDQLYEAYTDSNGSYTLTIPNNRVVNLNISANDITELYNSISTFFYTEVNNQYLEPIRIIQSTGDVNLSGYVYDGRTSSTKIPEVTLKARAGFNTRYGEIVAETVSDSTGDYTLNLPKGNYTLEFSKNEWSTEYLNVTATENIDTMNYYLTQSSSNYLARNAFATIVLTWGDRPSDLDTHLLLPSDTTNAREHLYYSNKVIGNYPNNTLLPCDTQGVIASLDVDDTSAYGPETLSICERYAHDYKYYIYNYSGSPQFDVSNARVSVTTSTGQSRTFNVPYIQGNTARYWHVFDIDSYGNIIPINELTSTTPTY